MTDNNTFVERHSAVASEANDDDVSKVTLIIIVVIVFGLHHLSRGIFVKMKSWVNFIG